MQEWRKRNFESVDYSLCSQETPPPVVMMATCFLTLLFLFGWCWFWGAEFLSIALETVLELAL